MCLEVRYWNDSRRNVKLVTMWWNDTNTGLRYFLPVFFPPFPALPPNFLFRLGLEPLIARTPSLREPLDPKSLSKVPFFLPFARNLEALPPILVGDDLEAIWVIFEGWFAFFAERIDALMDFSMPYSLSSSAASFRRLARRDRPANLSRLG